MLTSTMKKNNKNRIREMLRVECRDFCSVLFHVQELKNDMEEPGFGVGADAQ
jgi:hypothetical protein